MATLASFGLPALPADGNFDYYFLLMSDYQRIEEAIEFIHSNYVNQPKLEEIAAYIHVSPFHFQRMFKEWAGVSPKKFLQYISLQHAKYLLDKNHTVADTAFETGLSGSSRLHDLFITIEGMTPGEYKNGGALLNIQYDITDSPFGKIFIVSTAKGISNIFFTDNEITGLNELKKTWPNATIKKEKNKQHELVARFFNNDWHDIQKIKLHLKGTDFQLKVWEALLKIPTGKLTTYATIAERLNHPKASRAVGSAVGDNPIAYLIPCHRVIRSTGVIGEYHWGSTRKTAIIG
ncbi:MAG TPA: methylated-DNA--[protein]-cysteine S-methyltransferase, partial [Flavipsychrobacter sp.]|nr:methylated-DNA--[protein]-cysteine S-methyltransferase [Flavipsychrobacter sp.]